MTKSEYFENNKISFAEAMRLFNEQTEFKSFDKFLASEHKVFKFKVGDIVVLQLNKETRRKPWVHNVVFAITGIDTLEDIYEVKYLTPTDCNEINDNRIFSISFLERNAVLY